MAPVDIATTLLQDFLKQEVVVSTGGGHRTQIPVYGPLRLTLFNRYTKVLHYFFIRRIQVLDNAIALPCGIQVPESCIGQP
jgi:hypothetical protein